MSTDQLRSGRLVFAPILTVSSSYLSLFLEQRRLCFILGIIQLSKYALYRLLLCKSPLFQVCGSSQRVCCSFLRSEDAILGLFSRDLQALSQICLSRIQFALGLGRAAIRQILLLASIRFFFIICITNPDGTLYAIQLAQPIHPSINSTLQQSTMQTHYPQQHSSYPLSLSGLIINADDYGYCQERSMGILQLIKGRCITSTSVIVNGVHSEEMCGRLLKLVGRRDGATQKEAGGDSGKIWVEDNWEEPQKWEVSIGLHLNLTEFTPLSLNQESQIPSIVDPATKIFKGKQYLYSTLPNLCQDPSLFQFLHCQVHAQIKKFILLLGRRPSHIDGHNHVHLIPEIAELVCQVARLYGIYKVRLPIVVKGQGNGQGKLEEWNRKFVALADTSRGIYDHYGFLYPDYFVGLDVMGKDFTVQNIAKKIEDIVHVVGKQQIRKKKVQIMVHPGYPQVTPFKNYTTCPFSQSPERQQQLKVLKSQQFATRFHCCLTSYHNLSQKMSQKTVIIYSKLTECTGNYTTSLRLAKILRQYMGFRVYFLNVPDSNCGGQEQQIRYLRKMINDMAAKFIIGVNLTRTAGIICKAVNMFGYKVPYVLVIAGTDANVTLQTGTKEVLDSISQSIRGCECLVSLSQKMQTKMQSFLTAKAISKQIVMIPQSSLNQSNPSTPTQLPLKKPYIIFPTSFRKVKSVGHILPQLNLVIHKHNLNVYIVGPIINEQYYQQTHKELGSVVYLGCVPHGVYLQMLRDAIVMINCSESEGMSCAVLEAFWERVPVIVRENQGNCQLVTDGVNGYVYHTGEDFIEKFEYLLLHYNQQKQRLCSKAYEIFSQKFSFQKECQAYKTVLDQYITPLIYPLDLHTTQHQKLTFHILSIKNVHPVSPVNLSIFNKFFIKDQDNINPCCIYVGKMLASSDKQEKCINILDVGCGNGIFAIYFILKFMQVFHGYNQKIRINLTFMDIHAGSLNNLKTNLRTLKQALNSKLNTNLIISKVTIIQSQMFQQLGQNCNSHFDLILANMPQTPFKNSQSRVDKNGGSDGFKLTITLVQNYQKYLHNSHSILVTLFSHMLEQKKYKKLVADNESKIDWISKPEIHRVRREDYETMEEGLASIIQHNVKMGNSGVSIEGDVFCVPADLRLIRPV